MPAQNRAASNVSSPSATAAADDSTSKKAGAGGVEDEANSNGLPCPPPDSPQDPHDGEGGTTSSQSSGEKDEYIIVKLADIRKEVQCPICLGIIRKTRTVMECLHRFCRECIDKSMRLGNNECPACRTHCASRRCLRDDPNYDALIAALYPDIDKYEEEELAFHEEEKNRNKKIQASIAETFRRQSEALGRRRPTAKATAAAFLRRSHGSYRTVQNSYFRCRGRPTAHNASPAVSNDDEEEDVSSNDAGKDSSSVEEASPDRRPKRCRRMPAPKSSPARFHGNADLGCEENYDLEMNRESFCNSPLRAGNRELAWGKGGVRSQSRHGNSSGSNGRFIKAARLTRLTNYLHNLDENEDKFDVHLKLLPLNEQSLPLESPYACCPSGLSIRCIQRVNIVSNPSHNHFHFKLKVLHLLKFVNIYELLQFIAIQTSVQDEGIDIFVRKPRSGSAEKVQLDPSQEMLMLGAEESIAGLLSSFTFSGGYLELLYRAHARNES